MKKRSLLTNISNNCVIRKINIYFFDVMKIGQLENWKIVMIVFLLVFCEALQYEESFGEVSPSHFLKKYLTETSNDCFKNF